MRKTFSIILVIVAFILSSCSSSKKLVLKVEEHKNIEQALTVPVDYSSIADIGDVGYKAELFNYNGYLYIGNLDGEVYKIDPKNGDKELVVEFDEQPIEAGVVVDGDYLFVGTTKGWLYKVDLKSKKVVAKRRFDFPVVGHLYIKDGNLYVVSENDILYCLDESDLKTVWKYAHGEPNMFDIRGFSGIYFGDDGLYIGFDDGSVDKVSYKGDQIWEAEVGEGSMFVDADTTPLLNGNIVYVSSVRGYTEALKTDDGSLVWKRKISSYSNMQANIFGLFLADDNGNVYCLDLSGGETIWKKRLTLEGNIYSLKLVGSILFALTSDGKLIALDPLTGKILDIKDIGGEFSSYMMLCCNKLFFVSRDGDIYAVFSKR
ncbi:PQQ-binding-like beta-propeller repeat protein [Hippea alviniae]|uniref:outer membrane protein assembly factor BamB family protein n=1 Tax=Hippea alviniae TaxID=1279027 RepID=UPI0003B5D2B7|nr:PQQ-binding-like beta-propeller repeat protein [Hippea alviniae]